MAVGVRVTERILRSHSLIYVRVRIVFLYSLLVAVGDEFSGCAMVPIPLLGRSIDIEKKMLLAEYFALRWYDTNGTNGTSDRVSLNQLA